MTAPLQWPPSLKHPTNVQKVLMGFPLIGSDIRACRQFRKKMAHRTNSCLTAWKQNEQTLRVRDRIIKILQDEMEWPNGNFLPDDPCNILFFDPTMDLKAGTAIMGIEDLVGHELDGDSLKKMTLVQFVEHVAAARRKG